METASPLYRITTKSGIVIADNLLRSAPAIRLDEGTLSKGDSPPKDLLVGESSVVSYPLAEGSLVCRVTRTDGNLPILNMGVSFDFVEPDTFPKKGKPKISESLAKQVDAAIENVKVRRGRGRRAAK